MQGRLSPTIEGKIQAFPAGNWPEEFALASDNNFPVIEWTLDHEGLAENPLMTGNGRRAIREICSATGVGVRSVTSDSFMQAPFHRFSGRERATFLDEFRFVLDACNQANVDYLVVPLVDNGRIETLTEQEDLIRTLPQLVGPVSDAFADTRILFESDFGPSRLKELIAEFPSQAFGINYDIGNSASDGFDPNEEIGMYGSRILNVHVKDRPLGGTTVPLGDGNADFEEVFGSLRNADYAGNYILQTARAKDTDHLGVLTKYRDMVCDWLRDS
ncbi:MAG: TIM barrel protein [Alphaproteobacteria bacterium]|nr:TIM barrel protein [Alphaproteobacteria bacterium]